MKKTILSVVTSTLLSTFVVAGVAYAASINATSLLGGNSGDDFEFDGTGRFNSVYIGKQGSGGVTFFNGTIVNNTTTNNADNPVTFGDNIRIDGRVWRGESAGTSDSLPFIINDNAEIAGTLSVNGTDIDSAFVSKTAPEWDEQTSYVSFSRYDVNLLGATDANVDDTDGLVAGASRDEFFGGIQLPHGATITELAAMYQDTAPDDLIITLEKREMDGNNAREVIATVTSQNGSTSGEETGLTEVVDNDTYSYFIHVNFSGIDDNTLGFHDLKVTYTHTSPN